MVAGNQFPQHNGLLGRKSAVPPIVDKKGEELLRNSGLRAGVERVERFPFPASFAVHRFLNQTEDRQSAVEVVFSSCAPRWAVAVKKDFPMLFERDDRSGFRILLRLLSERLNHGAGTEFWCRPAVEETFPGEERRLVFVLMSQWSSQLLE